MARRGERLGHVVTNHDMAYFGKIVQIDSESVTLEDPGLVERYAVYTYGEDIPVVNSDRLAGVRRMMFFMSDIHAIVFIKGGPK